MYIFEINSLSVASFAIIFSLSEGCLFTLLIVSFVMEKLLNVIRSHLFIFAFISITLGGALYFSFNQGNISCYKNTITCFISSPDNWVVSSLGVL